MDSTEHGNAGADIVLDEVHGGPITTYASPDTFRHRIVRPFRAAHDQNINLIIAELGGDLVSANVPTFLTMGEFVDNLRILMVIANDPFSAAGAVHYLTDELGFAGDRLRLFSSPFRNHRGMALRMAALGVEETFDPNDDGQVQRVVEDFLGE